MSSRQLTELQELEVFADVLCPFTHVGLHRIVSERDRRGLTVPRLRVRAWPLELVNHAPFDADSVAEKVAALREQVAPDLFAGFDRSRFPSTALPAFALAAAAYRRDVACGESVSRALRDAVFERGDDVSDPEVLAAIAADHGVGPVTDSDRASIESDWSQGTARGVLGSPHFFLASDDVFCPTLDISQVDGELHIRIDRPAFEDFVEQVFPTG